MDKLDDGTTLYGHRWQRRRLVWLLNHPLCRHCEEQGYTTAATVVDHREPHRGDPVLFWDEGNWQSLCDAHHNSAKQAEEKKGHSRAIGLDGWPLDKKHPANTGKVEEIQSKRYSKLRKRQGGVVKK